MADARNPEDPRKDHRLQEAQVLGERMLEDCFLIAREMHCWTMLRQDSYANLVAKARCSFPARSFQFDVDVDEVDRLHRSPEQVLETTTAKCNAKSWRG